MDPSQLASAELVEILRRSVALLPVGAPALNREDALLVLEKLEEAITAQRS